MNTRTYKIGDSIKNKNGLELQVQEIDSPSDKTIGEADSCYKTLCKKCGYSFEKVANNLEKQKFCIQCIMKSTAFKFDADGTCVSINGIELLEYIGNLMATHDLSERKAFELLVEMIRAKLPIDN